MPEPEKSMDTNLEKDEFFKKCVGRLLACRNILVKGGILTEPAAGCAVEIESCAAELREFARRLACEQKEAAASHADLEGRAC